MSQANAVPQSKTAPFFWPRRIGHANLFVSDYERAAEFYQSVVGFHEAYREPDNMASFVSNGNTYHDLALTDVRSKYAAKNQAPDLWHIAFEVETEADLVDGYRRSIGAGIEYAFVMDHDVAHSIYKHDPDGNLVEIYADIVQDWEEQRHGIIVKEKPEWIPGVTNVPSTQRNYPQHPQLRLIREAVFHPKKITHVALVAVNYEAMVDYYTRVVGLSLFAGSEKSSFVILRGTVGTCDVTLYRHEKGLKPGLHHVGFQVWSEQDLEQSLQALRARGMQADNDVNHPARRSVCITDPDGLRLHFCIDRRWTPEVLAGVDADVAYDLL